MAGTESDSESSGTAPQVVKTADVLGGDPRIEGHRIAVHQVYQRYTQGNESPEEIATAYEITVAEVHAALAYAFDNVEEMREIEQRDRELQEQDSPHRVVPDSDQQQ